jgi:protein-tyrosine phosphatase
MTSAHVQDLGTLVGQRAKSTAPQVLLLLDLVPQLDLVDVPDPYYKDNFELVYELIERGCKCLLDHIRAEEGL